MSLPIYSSSTSPPQTINILIKNKNCRLGLSVTEFYIKETIHCLPFCMRLFSSWRELEILGPLLSSRCEYGFLPRRTDKALMIWYLGWHGEWNSEIRWSPCKVRMSASKYNHVVSKLGFMEQCVANICQAFPSIVLFDHPRRGWVWLFPFCRQEMEVQRREELSQPRSGQVGGCVPSKTGTSTQPDFRVATGNEYPDMKLHRDLMREPQGRPPKLSWMLGALGQWGHCLWVSFSFFGHAIWHVGS